MAPQLGKVLLFSWEGDLGEIGKIKV
jgi:hypothetical protein